MKRPSEVPPPVESFGGAPVTSCTAALTASERIPAGGIEGLPGDEPLEGEAHAVTAQDLLDRRLEPLERLGGRVAQVEARPQLPGNDVRRPGPGVEVGDLEARRLEVLRALVPAPRR